MIQYLARLPLIQFGPPANCPILFNSLITVVTFNIFDTFDTVYPEFTPSEPFNSEFEKLGYDSKNIYGVLGSFNIFIALILLSTLITIVKFL